MTKHQLPPVPPAGRSDKTPSGGKRLDPQSHHGDADKPADNSETGRQKNIAVNTTNQGYQQDR